MSTLASLRDTVTFSFLSTSGFSKVRDLRLDVKALVASTHRQFAHAWIVRLLTRYRVSDIMCHKDCQVQHMKDFALSSERREEWDMELFL